MLVGSESDGLDQARVHPGQVPAFDHGAGWQLQKIEHLPDSEAVAPSLHLEHDDGALIDLSALLLQKQVPIEHGQEAATNVYQPFDRVWDTRNAGSRQAREDLTHDPCRGRADNLTDSKDDGVERGRVSHLY